jgi:hypothetical protein
MIYREPAPEGKIKIKIKYKGEELYQEGIVKTTVKEIYRVISRGREGLGLPRRDYMGRLLDAAECCNFADY